MFSLQPSQNPLTIKITKNMLFGVHRSLAVTFLILQQRLLQSYLIGYKVLQTIEALNSKT